MIKIQNFKHPAITQLNGSYWFHEVSEDAFPGQSFGLEVEQILHHSQSKFQDILIFRSRTFGNVLVLNGIVQCTEKDEFAYQELITHVPIMSHPNPKKVLVVGGGDCGVVREVVKHVDHGIEHISMVEIDRKVIELSVEYLPEMSKFHNHPNVNIIIQDGFKYLQDANSRPDLEKFDIIITDSSDPEGPAEEFFDTGYYELLKNALKPDGVVVMQSSENIWLNLPYLTQLLAKAKKVFSSVDYCQCYMPSYTGGQLGLVVASPVPNRDLRTPLRQFEVSTERDLFKYYSAEMHKASFVLPTWADIALNGPT